MVTTKAVWIFLPGWVCVLLEHRWLVKYKSVWKCRVYNMYALDISSGICTQDRCRDRPCTEGQGSVARGKPIVYSAGKAQKPKFFVLQMRCGCHCGQYP